MDLKRMPKNDLKLTSMYWMQRVIHSMGSAKKTVPVIVGLVVFMTVLLHASFHYQSVWFDSIRGSSGVGPNNDKTNKDWSHVEQIQLERKEHLRQSCAALGYSQRFVKRNLNGATLKKFSRIHVIPELKVIYCPIPKVASTSWRRFLLKATNRDASKPVPNSKRLFPKLSSFPLSDAKRILGTYQRFLFVRNPYSRLLSAYKNKLLGKRAELKPLLKKWYKKHYPQEVKGMDSLDSFSFRQFVHHYLEAGNKNVHWEDMMELCHPCDIDYTFIGHLETLKEDSDYLIDLLGIPDGLSFPDEERPQTNSSQRDTLQTFYAQLANGQYKDLSFSQGLARDALLFGYDTPDSIKRF